MSTYDIPMGPGFGWDQIDPRAWRRMRRAAREARRNADGLPPHVDMAGAPHRGHRHGGRPQGPGEPNAGPGFGPAPGFGPDFGFGPGGPFGPGWRRGRRGRGRGRAGRGDTRLAILALLADGPRHGYQLIQDIAERSEGAWRPSPGSIYPALSALQDEGLVDDEKVDGKRVFSLTDAGRAFAREHADDFASVFTDNGPADVDGPDPRRALAALAAAAVQVVQVGTPDQQARAVAVIDAARRDLYLLLAEPTPDAPVLAEPAVDATAADEAAAPGGTPPVVPADRPDEG